MSINQIEYGTDGIMKWERVELPLYWKAADAYVVASRHLPDGTRQHMVAGHLQAELIIDDVQMVGELDVPDAEFSSQLSQISEISLNIDYKDLFEQACEQLDVMCEAYKAAVQAPSTLYGFFHTSCIHESAHELMSLHKTKKGALKAMIAHQYAAWLEAQKECRRLNRRQIREAMKEYPDFKKWSRKNKFWRKAYVHCESHVAPVEVNP